MREPELAMIKPWGIPHTPRKTCGNAAENLRKTCGKPAANLGTIVKTLGDFRTQNPWFSTEILLIIPIKKTGDHHTRAATPNIHFKF